MVATWSTMARLTARPSTAAACSMCVLARRRAGTVVSSGGNEYVSSGASALGTQAGAAPGFQVIFGLAGIGEWHGRPEWRHRVCVGRWYGQSGGTVSAGGNDNVFGSAVSATLNGGNLVDNGAAIGTTIKQRRRAVCADWRDGERDDGSTAAARNTSRRVRARAARAEGYTMPASRLFRSGGHGGVGRRLSRAAALNTCRRVV